MMMTFQPRVQKSHQQSSAMLLNHAGAFWRLGLLFNAQRECTGPESTKWTTQHKA